MSGTIKLYSLEKTENGNLRYGNGSYPVRDLIWKDIITLADVIGKSSKASLDMANHIKEVDKRLVEKSKLLAELSESHESLKKSTFGYKSKTTLSINRNKESIASLQKSVENFKSESLALSKKQDEIYKELNRKILDLELRLTSHKKEINQISANSARNSSDFKEMNKQTSLFIKIIFVLVIISLLLNFII